MDSDWNRPQVVDGWLGAVGGQATPFGDGWRTRLVNPVIADVIHHFPKVARHRGEVCGPIGTRSLHAGLARWRNWNGRAERRHFEILESFPDGFTVLDLGCGEGYLGRWLSRFGIDYIGLDVSSALIRAAKERAKGHDGGRSTFADCDMDGDAFSPNGINTLLAGRQADLVTCVAVIEHMLDPMPMLRWVSRHLADRRNDTAFLLVTLNRDYFDNGLEPDRREGAPIGAFAEMEQPFLANIASAGADVRIQLRFPQTVERMLRDAGFLSIRSGPLHFHPGDHPEGHRDPDTGNLMGVEPSPLRGIAPFRGHLCRAIPAPEIDMRSEEMLEWLLNDPGSRLSRFSPEEKAIIRAHAGQTDVRSYKPGEMVLAPHNLGGDLYVVTRGTLGLQREVEWDRPATEPDWHAFRHIFGEKDMFGDLETGEQGRTGRYPFPVMAGPDGASVLRIPADVAHEVISKHACGSAELFRQLRDRVTVGGWSSDFRTAMGKPVTVLGPKMAHLAGHGKGQGKKPNNSITFEHLDRVVRALLAASDDERLSGDRSPFGMAIFLPLEELRERTGKTNGSADPFNQSVRLLVQLRIADMFAPEDLPQSRRNNPTLFPSLNPKSEPADIEVGAFVGGMRKTVITHAVRTFLAPAWERTDFGFGVHAAHIADKAMSVGSLVDLPAKKGNGKEAGLNVARAVPKWTSSARELRKDILVMGLGRGVPRSDGWEAAVDAWMGWLCAFDRMWRSMSFVYIHDLQALRSIALGTDEGVRRDLDQRWAAMCQRKNWIDDLPELRKEAEVGSLCLYLRRLCEFAIADIDKRGGTLAFSGAKTGYRSPV
jgi:2-polyprenyl-3-methyl-5-hydroxy-6-metoxy-1,4-benzoquinol methylase